VQENAALVENKLVMEKKMSDMQREHDARTEILQAYESKMHDATHQLMQMKSRLEEALQVRPRACSIVSFVYVYFGFVRGGAC
jgi:hypothetical protein